MGGKFSRAHCGLSSACQRVKASSRHCSIHSGSPFLAEMKRMVSVVRPRGAKSWAMSVTKPCL